MPRGRPKKIKNAEIAPKNEENSTLNQPIDQPTEAEIAEAGIKELRKLYVELEERGIDSVGKLLIMIEQAEIRFKEILSR